MGAIALRRLAYIPLRPMAAVPLRHVACIPIRHVASAWGRVRVSSWASGPVILCLSLSLPSCSPPDPPRTPLEEAPNADLKPPPKLLPQ